MTSRDWLELFGALALASLVPVVWAIVDVARRPPWQFSTGRKVMWAFSLGFGWLLLWPVALVSSIVYLTVLRRRFPPSGPPGQQLPPYGHSQSPYGQYGHGPGPYWGGPPTQGGPGPSPGPYGGPSPGPYGGPSPGPYGGGYGFPPQATPPRGPQPPQLPVPPPEHLPPAGWYPDPAGSDRERWWDGRGWTDHLR